MLLLAGGSVTKTGAKDVKLLIQYDGSGACTVYRVFSEYTVFDANFFLSISNIFILMSATIQDLEPK